MDNLLECRLASLPTSKKTILGECQVRTTACTYVLSPGIPVSKEADFRGHVTVSTHPRASHRSPFLFAFVKKYETRDIERRTKNRHLNTIQKIYLIKNFQQGRVSSQSQPILQTSCRICFPFRMKSAIIPSGSNTEAIVDNMPLLVVGWLRSAT